MKARPLVEIVWVDSHTPDCGAWIGLDEVNWKNLELSTAGYAVHLDDETIGIASSYDHAGSSDQISGVMVIPLVAIKSIRRLA